MTTADFLHRLAGPRPKTRKVPVGLPIGRTALAKVFKDLRFTRGAEIGVWKGAFSACLLEGNPRLRMLCVDPWTSYPAWLDTKNSLPAEEAERFMAEALAIALARLGPLNATVVRKFSTDAALEVEDGSLDFVYIDGNHVEAAVREDLEAWTPKVRKGGIVAGHDYRVFSNKPTIHVVEAVRAWTTERGIAPWYITAGDKTPSFLWAVT